MIYTPDQKEIIQRGERYEQLVTHPNWEHFVRDIFQKRDNWLSQTANNADRAYLSAQAHTVNLLANFPFSCIEQKNNLVALLNQQEHEARESDKTLPDEPQSRPPPQFA